MSGEQEQFNMYSGTFFWDFKRMDNANYNFDILATLCSVRRSVGVNTRHINKPIVVTIVGIIECILYDFAMRVTQYRHEQIPNLDQSAVNDTRAKTLDQLEPLVAHVRKNNLLRTQDDDGLYDDLDYLRRLRNRVHIQNSQHQLDKDEYRLWTDEDVKLAGYALERVCEVMCHSYPRPDTAFVSMSKFPRPWNL